MRGPKPEPLTLSEDEYKALDLLVRRHSTPQQLALRGRIILTAAEGKNNSQIARQREVSVDLARHWRKRWQAVSLDDLSVSERLSDALRPGRPSRITAEQTCQMIVLACEQPKERPISHWTGREIADEVMRRGIIAQISPRHGTRSFILSRDVVTGKLLAPSYGPTRTEADFLAYLQAVVALDPQVRRWHIICDQLNTHQSEALVRWVAQISGIDQDLGVKGQSGILASMVSRAACLSDPTRHPEWSLTPLSRVRG